MTVPRWRVIGAAVTGTSHLHSGQVCADAYASRVYDNDLLCVVVADGAGSASYAALGAKTAVQAALDGLALLLSEQAEPAAKDQWESLLKRICMLAHDALVRCAQNTFASLPTQASQADILRHFATTFLLTIVSQDWLVAAQIGDGAIVVRHANGVLDSLTPRRRGKYFNETNFLTESTYLDRVIYTVRQRADLAGLAMLTDGLELLALDFSNNTPYAPFFDPLFAFALKPVANSAEIESFLASQQVCERTDDDKTLVLAVYAHE
ncbi:MAG TPA: PP2C family serine/threonine-protein phosphatase [Ktedonobacteraceae bacterium]